jgi:hypothetical protein
MTQQKRVDIKRGDCVEALSSTDASLVAGIVTMFHGDDLMVRPFTGDSPVPCFQISRKVDWGELGESQTERAKVIHQELGLV